METVRYYERRGLLDQPPRPAAGYRRYCQGDVERLAFVLRAKQLGFTLSEIVDLLHSSDSGATSEVLSAARAKVDALRHQEAEARRMQGLLNALVAACEDDKDKCLGLWVDPPAGQTTQAP